MFKSSVKRNVQGKKSENCEKSTGYSFVKYKKNFFLMFNKPISTQVWLLLFLAVNTFFYV